MKTKHLFYGGAALAAALIAGSALSVNAHADSNDDNGISINTHGSGSNKQINVNVKGMDGCDSAAVLTNQGNIDNIKNQLDINDSDVNDIANMSLSDAKSTAKDKLSDVADNALTYYQAHSVNGIDEHDVSQVLQTIRKRANNNIDHATSAKQVSQIYEDALEGAEASAQPTTLKVSADTNNSDNNNLNSNSNSNSNSASSSSSSQNSSSSSSEAPSSSSSSSSHRDSSSNRHDNSTSSTLNNRNSNNTASGSTASTGASNTDNQASAGQDNQNNQQSLHFSSVQQFLNWEATNDDPSDWPQDITVTTMVHEVYDPSDVDEDSDFQTDFLGDDSVEFYSTQDYNDLKTGDIVTVKVAHYDEDDVAGFQDNGSIIFTDLQQGDGNGNDIPRSGANGAGNSATDPDGSTANSADSKINPSTLPQTGAAVMNNKAVVLSGSILAVLAAVSGGVVLNKNDKK